MSIIDNLVYDRTQADVDRVFTLKNKILTEGLSSLSAEEKTEYMAGMKGAYNYGDMNRVGQAVVYIANRMTSLPGQLAAYRAEKGVADDPIYHVPYDPSSVVVAAKTNWAMGDTPTQSLVKAYLNDPDGSPKAAHASPGRTAGSEQSGQSHFFYGKQH